MTNRQVELLNSVAFAWKRDHASQRVEAWEAMYQELVAFQRQHGHLHIPVGQYPKLAHWVSYQRRKGHALDADRTARLKAIGFFKELVSKSPYKDWPADVK